MSKKTKGKMKFHLIGKSNGGGGRAYRSVRGAWQFHRSAMVERGRSMLSES